MHAPINITPLAGWQLFLRRRIDRGPGRPITLAGKPHKGRKKKETATHKADAHLVGAAARILGGGRSSKFEYEGAVRHGLRSEFCLGGLPWSKADSRAASIVEKALHQLGATRPTWVEAQPEHTQDGHRPTTYMLCQRCGKPLAADAREGSKFCSRTCKDSAHSSFRVHLRRLEGEAGMRAVMAARVEARKKTLGKYLCETCGTEFERKWKPQGYRFCSHGCAGKSEYVLEPQPCAHCGHEFHPGRGHALHCSEDCRKAANKAYMKAYHAARHPPPPERPCAVCGRPFCPAKSDALYCSHACNSKAWRARQRASV